MLWEGHVLPQDAAVAYEGTVREVRSACSGAGPEKPRLWEQVVTGRPMLLCVVLFCFVFGSRGDVVGACVVLFWEAGAAT